VERELTAIEGKGTVRVWASRLNDGGDAYFLVSDSGPGIPDELRARVIEPYFGTKSTGTGLGLAIVAHIVEAHAGRLTIQGGEDRGTVIEIELPEQPPAQ
jgi:two-component system NtrC family sensor kinase